MLYLPTERTLHKTVEPTANQIFDRKIRTKSQNLSEDTQEGYAAIQSTIPNAGRIPGEGELCYDIWFVMNFELY